MSRITTSFGKGAHALKGLPVGEWVSFYQGPQNLIWEEILKFNNY